MTLRLYSILFEVKGGGQERINLPAHDVLDAIQIANLKMILKGYKDYSLADLDALFEPLDSTEVKPS